MGALAAEALDIGLAGALTRALAVATATASLRRRRRDNKQGHKHQQGSNQQTVLSVTDTLSAEGLIPDFSIQIADLFA